MAGKREKPEDIVLKLKQVEVLQGQGRSTAQAVRQIGVTFQTYYRWRKECGGMSRDQLKRLKELEAENTRLLRAVSHLALDKMILAEAARGTEGPRSETSKPFSPARQCIDHVRPTLSVSERRVCRTLGQHRSTQAARCPVVDRTRHG